MENRARLILYFEKYNPEKVIHVDTILGQYVGRESALWVDLVKKYGPEPEAPNLRSPKSGPNHRARLVRFFTKYHEEKVSSADQILLQYKGQEDVLWDQLIKKYGPEPAAESEHRPRLIRFFEKYNPEKVSSVDSILGQYAGKENALWEALIRKYGPEAGAPPVVSRLRLGTTLTSGVPNPSRQRLVAFYTTYAKERLHKVDETLAKYANNIEQLFIDLVKKYGPEPMTHEGPLVHIAPGYNPSSTIAALGLVGKTNNTRSFLGCGTHMKIEGDDRRKVTKVIGSPKEWNCCTAVCDIGVSQKKKAMWALTVHRDVTDITDEAPCLLVGVCDENMPLNGDRNYMTYPFCAFVDVFDGSCFAKGRPAAAAFRRDVAISSHPVSKSVANYQFSYDAQQGILQCLVDGHEMVALMTGTLSSGNNVASTVYVVVELYTPGTTVEIASVGET